jgi:hypothetical protein
LKIQLLSGFNIEEKPANFNYQRKGEESGRRLGQFSHFDLMMNRSDGMIPHNPTAGDLASARLTAVFSR